MSTILNNYEIKIIRKKIKHTYIRVKDNTIVVTTNYLVPRMYINKLIRDNTELLEKMILKSEEKKNDSNEFYLFGKHYDIVYDCYVEKVTINNDIILVRDEDELNKYIDLLVRDVFSEHLDFWYNKFEERIPVPNLKIRKMKSRWGVCNIKNNNVTLNYYLYKYDLSCLDYVIVHELSHFIEGNHSKKFWEVVCKYCPNYKEEKKKLRS